MQKPHLIFNIHNMGDGDVCVASNSDGKKFKELLTAVVIIVFIASITVCN